MSGTRSDFHIVAARNDTFSGGQTFAGALADWLRAAPWLAVSVAVHALIALVLVNVEWRTVYTDEPFIIAADYLPEDPEPLLDEVIEKPEERTVEDVEPNLHDPVVSDVEIPDIVDEQEVPDDQIYTGDMRDDFIRLPGGDRYRVGLKGSKYRRRGTPGGGPASQKAVDSGLDWLARHQHHEGFWDCDGFHHQCSDVRCSGKGQALNDVGCTGLALLAYLGAGSTVTSGPHRKTVKKGVKYLKEIQDPEDGCLVPKEGPHWMYNHAIAALALTEAYGLSRMPQLRRPAQRAVDFIHQAKNPGRAWRYNNGELDPAEQNDVSVTGWMMMCLASAKDFGLVYYEQDMRDALLYLDDMTDTATGRTGYREKGQGSSREPGDEAIWPFSETEAMTAVAMFCRVFAGHMLGDMDAQLPYLESGAALLRKKLPAWDEERGSIDYYYWYYGTYAMYQMAGKDWKIWKTAMERTIVENQVKEGCACGSWDPRKDPWGDSGGRVYATALMILSLEVFYRYDNILGTGRSAQ